MPVIDGTTDNDNLLGTSDADEINGFEGNDVIDGGLGADTLNGGDGDDRFVFTQSSGDPGIGTGLIDGGDGHDIIDLRAIGASWSAPAPSSGELYIGGQLFQFQNVEEIWLGDGNHHVDFGSVATSLIIRSGPGNDFLYGGLEADQLYGGGGADRIYARNGDQVFGEAGNDLLYFFFIVGAGMAYDGGAGSDTLVIQTNWGHVTDLQAGTGVESLLGQAYTVSEIEHISVSASLGSTYTLYGSAGANTLGVSADQYNEATIVADGRDGNDTLNGGYHDDVLTGGTGADALNGRDGDDILDGGLGADVIAGGQGFDTAVFSEGLFADYVITLGPEYGTLIVTLGTKSDVLTGINRLEFTDQTIETSLYVAGLAISGDGDANVIVGGEWHDTLSGLEGDDTLNGLEGDDVLDGGDGDDTLQASRGMDLLHGGAGDDRIVETPTSAQGFLLQDGASLDGGDGIDTFLTQSSRRQIIDLASGTGQTFDDSNTLISTFSLANIENVLTSGYTGVSSALYGDEADNALGVELGDGAYIHMHAEGRGGDDRMSGGRYADVLHGDDGDDLLIGAGDSDALVGGDGSDTAGYAHSGAAVSVNLAAGAATGGDAEGDAFSSIENLIGSGHDDILIGDTGANILEGGVGADTLDGAGGLDAASYRSSLQAVNIHLGSGARSGGDAVGDVFISIENLIGSAFNDALTGDGGANRLDGGDGDDVLGGGNGDDILRGGLGADSLNGGSGIDDMDGGEGADSLSGGAGDDQMAGGGGDDILLGAAGSDTLSGGEGADNLQGGADGDSLSGGSGDDILNGGDGADALSGSDGIDTVTYAGGPTGVTVNLGTGVGTGGWAQADTLFGIENLIGTGKADTLTGNGGANLLEGGGGDDGLQGGDGADTLNGSAGADTLGGGDGDDALTGGTGADTLNGGNGSDIMNGGSENDTLNGGADNDALTGGTGDDTLNGGLGDDVLNAGAGADLMTGGSGADQFVFGGGWGQDRIADFSAGLGAGDMIVFSAAVFADFAAVMAATADDGLGNTVITRGSNSLTLTGVTKARLNADDFAFTPPAAPPSDPLILPAGLESKASAIVEDGPVICPPGEGVLPTPDAPVVEDSEISLAALAETSLITRLLLTAYPERTEWTDWIT